MSVFAARYARALADVVLEAKLDPAEVQQQLEDFAVSFRGSHELRQVLLNPSTPAAARVAALDAVNRRIGCRREVRNFLAVLIGHERLSALDEILEAYRWEMNRRLKISEAEVVTTRPLEDQERRDLEQKVVELAGTKVNATFREDQSLIGGVIVRIGSTIYDGSVKGHLERLKDRLVAG